MFFCFWFPCRLVRPTLGQLVWLAPFVGPTSLAHVARHVFLDILPADLTPPGRMPSHIRSKKRMSGYALELQRRFMRSARFTEEPGNDSVTLHNPVCCTWRLESYYSRTLLGFYTLVLKFQESIVLYGLPLNYLECFRDSLGDCIRSSRHNMIV